MDCFETHKGRGTKVKRKFKQSAPARIRKLRQSSFFYRGAQLFNLLSAELRQIEDIENPGKVHVKAFKDKLGKYLAGIPDQPTTPGLFREAATNSLVNQIPLRETKRREET